MSCATCFTYNVQRNYKIIDLYSSIQSDLKLKKKEREIDIA